MQNRVMQVLITCLVVIVFWNLLDYIFDEYVTHEGWVFSAGYNVLLPVAVGLAVELFPKRRK